MWVFNAIMNIKLLMLAKNSIKSPFVHVECFLFQAKLHLLHVCVHCNVIRIFLYLYRIMCNHDIVCCMISWIGTLIRMLWIKRWALYAYNGLRGTVPIRVQLHSSLPCFSLNYWHPMVASTNLYEDWGIIPHMYSIVVIDILIGVLLHVVCIMYTVLCAYTCTCTCT